MQNLNPEITEVEKLLDLAGIEYDSNARHDSIVVSIYDSNFNSPPIDEVRKALPTRYSEAVQMFKSEIDGEWPEIICSTENL